MNRRWKKNDDCTTWSICELAQPGCLNHGTFLPDRFQDTAERAVRLPDVDCFGIWMEPRRYEQEPPFNGIDWKSPPDDEVIEFDFHYDENESC